MDIEKAYQLFKTLEDDDFAQNLIAQSNAKNILLTVKENEENFPNFTEGLTDRINSIAFAYLSIACTIAEKKEIDEVAIKAFTKAGDAIYYTHAPISTQNTQSHFYLIVSSLSFYLASQYSKSFIAIKNIELKSPFSELIGNFLKKDFKTLIHIINSISFDDKFYNVSEDELEQNNKHYTVILSKSLNLVLEYIYSGEEKYLNRGEEFLTDLKALATIDDEPVVWWLARLLIILLHVLKRYSFWSVLPPLIEGETTKNYVAKLALQKQPVTELFLAQYNALKVMQDKNNIVLSLPTSSGKTRLAEIAILENLTASPTSKVLYLAPFRSLAYEVEQSMEKMLAPLGFTTTFLYGGGQFSKLDKTLIENSNIIIATPEKAKAIVRADENIANEISLLIIDEGHLLGADERLIKIELFIEELKLHIKRNNGKIILLSAVLPNTNDIAKWIAKDKNSVYQTEQTIANKRFGIIQWTHSKNINIEWLGEPPSFNKSFVDKFLPPNAKSKYFPNDKNEGVAATALKLSQLGTVLLFVPQAKSIVPSAKRILKSMGTSQQQHTYKKINLFETFKLACDEAGINDIYELAQYGILCHHGKLPSDVRIIIEQIMRSETVKVIVSTSSLGQGVNIGISTVIFADVFMNHQEGLRIDSKDFWNIAGRAGRAFTDIEGKVLYCIDATHWNYQENLKLSDLYFDQSKMENADSGLLSLIREIKSTANSCGIDFELLLELVASNDFRSLKKNDEDYSKYITELFDWIDDTLLALNYKHEANKHDDPSFWIDDVFRSSLAYIQTEQTRGLSQEEVISFLKSRNSAVLRIAGNYTNWESMIKSGIPLSCSKALDNYVEPIRETLRIYKESETSSSDVIKLSQSIEKIIQQLPSLTFQHNYDEIVLDEVRAKWFNASPLSEIVTCQNGQDICVSYFSMNLPWAINAIVRKFYDLELDEDASLLEELALYCEIGVPNMDAVKIYLAGLKSRITAYKLSSLLEGKFKSLNKSQLTHLIIDNYQDIKLLCDDVTLKWIELFILDTKNAQEGKLAEINNFTLKRQNLKSNILTARSFNGKMYLCSPCLSEKIPLKPNSKVESIANNPKIYFEKENSSWAMKVRGES